jgi:hypothetical protein
MDHTDVDDSQIIRSWTSLDRLLDALLTVEEQEQISQQFNHACRQDSQVFWSGIPRNYAQAWADARELQTLTTAMGPLMDNKHPSCLRCHKSPRAWQKYMKGASALFARHVSTSMKVTVLTPPPPLKFNPCELSTWQLIEERILKGFIGGHAVGHIDMVHPIVEGAEEFAYESWPVDATREWITRFPNPHIRVKMQPWRWVPLKQMIKQVFTIVTDTTKTDSTSAIHEVRKGS